MAAVPSFARRGPSSCLQPPQLAPPAHPPRPQSPAAPTQQILAGDGVLPRLVSLLGSPTSNVAESAAIVLACCCTGAAEQSAVAAAGAVAPLVSLLSAPQRSKQEAALEALAALSRDNADTSQAVLQRSGVVGSLLRAIKQGGSPHTRFVAAVCLANLSRNLPAGHQEHSQQVGMRDRCCITAVQPGRGSVALWRAPALAECPAPTAVQRSLPQPSALSSSPARPLPCPQDLQQAVLPVLVRLLGEAGVAEDVPGALGQLVGDNAELQQAAADADAIAKLAAILRWVLAGRGGLWAGQGGSKQSHAGQQLVLQPANRVVKWQPGRQCKHPRWRPCRSDPARPPRLVEGALRCLATLCSSHEEHRRQLMECRVLPQVGRALPWLHRSF